MIMECRVNKPYPKIEVEEENIVYANILLEDYAGVVSELSAIHQYIYQKFEKFNEKEEFAKTLSSIAMVEMKHLELLGETIKLLGVDPKFKYADKTNYLNYWNSSFVNYNTDIIAMLKDDIKIEEEAIQSYKCHIRIIDDKYVKQLLYRIVEDEEKHIECFKTLLYKAIYNLNN